MDKFFKLKVLFRSFSSAPSELNSVVHHNEGILKGIRVLDLTRIVAGPYCTMILGDYGAEIIKVEKCKTGDELRNWGPFFKDTRESCYFVALNRNKKGVCVDMKSVQGKEILYDLSKHSDVLIENYIPGKLDEMKLGYDDFKKVSPHLIYCSITGYGPDGPYSKKPGYDTIAASVGGLLHTTGPKNGEPCKPGVALVDMATGLYAHGAILAALIQRSKTGHGVKIDCNLLSTQIASLINLGSGYLNMGREAQRWGTEHESIVPYSSFPTKDGYLTLGTGSNSQFKDFCSKINKPDLCLDEKFKNNDLRVQNRDELNSTIKEILRTKTNKEWMEVFKDSSFPCGPVNTLEEVFNDEHVKSIELVRTIDHPKVGKIKVVGPPVKFSPNQKQTHTASPTLGQHTNEILQNILGYSIDKINTLRKNKVIE